MSIENQNKFLKRGWLGISPRFKFETAVNTTPACNP